MTNRTHKMSDADKCKGLIGKIHVAKSQLGLDDDTYRALLANTTGKTSCATMELAELQQVLRAFESRGWQAQGGRTVPKAVRIAVSADQTALRAKLAKLLQITGKSAVYADGTAKRMFGAASSEALTTQQLYKLVQAMQIHANKMQAAAAAETGGSDGV